jgi:NAD(P)-dependent dehydrogenase (short-subunit alcohol dehydrogenase family)
MRVTLITGAASGLGWTMARHWAAAGDALVLADIDAAALDARAHELAASGVGADRIATVAGDLTQAEIIARVVATARERFGRLDLLVNNAGITHRSPAHRTDPAVFRRVMAVDWQAPVELTLAALPLLRAARGAIVTIGSMAGWMPVPGRAGYGAAKAALTQWFEVLRLELEADGVHLLMVYPSFLDTPIERHALGADGAPAAHARSTVGRVRSAEATVLAIDRALQRRARWLAPDPLARFGALLWRIAPGWYLKSVRRRFGGELR